ncbi:MAG: hypothetical protein N3J91_01845 [Verrucomicrobiae bacterium]|nr:hypothetical protein [Verrucomicrobiae bacterium]
MPAMLLAVINVGVSLMVGALWLAVWLGWAGWATRRAAPPRGSEWRRARGFFTGGCVALAIHAFIAFDNFHNWSHEMAKVAMELRTAEYLPWQTGAAIYLTYLYLALWAVETLWSWAAFEAWQQRPRWLDWSIQAYLHLYGVVLILLLGGAAAHHLPPLLPGMLAVGVVAFLTWIWRRASRPASAPGAGGV